MRIRNVLFLSLFLAAPVWAQQPPARPQPSQPGKAPEKAKPAANSLEAVIADAMKNNPDIRAAEAKVREAQNNLSKVRSEVMVAVAAQYEIVKQAKEMLRLSEQAFAYKRQVFQKGQLSNAELMTAEIELQRSKGTAVEVEAALHKLVGRVPGMPGVGQADAFWSDRMVTTEWANRNYSVNPINLGWSTDSRYTDFSGSKGAFTPFPMADTHTRLGGATTASGSSNMIEKIRAALDKSVKIEKELQNIPVQDAFTYLHDLAAKDIPFRTLVKNSERTTVSLMPGELPLGAWLIAIQDEVPDLVLFVREYGILATTRERAPEGAIPVAEFWRSSKAAKPRADKPADKPKVEEKK